MSKGSRMRRFPWAGTLFLVLATVLLMVWIGSHLARLGILSLGADTSLDIQRGGIVIHHIYARAIVPPVPDGEWYDYAAARGWFIPPPTRGFPGFSFQDGLVMGEGSTSGTMISPAHYWQLRLPLWPLVFGPALLAAWLFRRWYKRNRPVRRGFEVAIAG